MTDDFAVEGDDGGYVPCNDMAAASGSVDETVAVSGQDEGRVPLDQSAHAEAAVDESSAIVGSDVGYVAKPCDCIPVERLLAPDLDIYSSYVMRRVLSATAMGGVTTIVSTTSLGSSGNLAGRWSSYDIESGGDQGGQELEDRVFINYLVPASASSVRLHGTATAVLDVTDLTTDGRPVDTIAQAEVVVVSYDPDTAPAFDPASSALFTTTTTVTGTTPFDTQTPVDIDVSTALFGSSIDIGDGNDWVLMQLMCKDVSLDGIARRTWFAAPGHADAEIIEIDDRFPSNPNWHRAGHPFGDYVDMSMVQSGVTTDLTLDAYTTAITCSIEDDFHRVTSGGLGGAWSVYLGSTSAFSTDGSKAVITPTSPAYEAGAEIFPADAYSDITIVAHVTGASSSSNRCFVAAEPADFTDSVYIEVATNGDILASTNFASATTSVAWSTASPFNIRVQTSGVTANFKVWPVTDPEPGSWLLTLAYAGTPTMDGDIDIGAFGPVTAYFDNLGCVGDLGCV